MSKLYVIAITSVMTFGAARVMADDLSDTAKQDAKLLRLEVANLYAKLSSVNKEAEAMRKELKDLKEFLDSPEKIQQFREWQAAKAQLAEQELAVKQEQRKLEAERDKLDQSREALLRTARAEAERQDQAERDQRRADKEKEEEMEKEKRREELARAREARDLQRQIDELNRRDAERNAALYSPYGYGYPYYGYSYYPIIRRPIVQPRRSVSIPLTRDPRVIRQFNNSSGATQQRVFPKTPWAGNGGSIYPWAGQ